MSINRVSLYHLETLLWIDRLGTFSAAAERLNTTQPTVSARMRELEQRLGTALFRREGRAMSLTAAGRKLVRDCDPLLRDMQVPLLGSGSQSRTSLRPAAVSDIARPSRRNNAVPRRCSSSRILADTVGWVVLSRSAAAEKVPSRSIHSKVSR